MTAFLTITKGGTSLDLDIDVDSARETDPEQIGSTSRAFDGSFRGDAEDFRTWSFVAVFRDPEEYDDLRDMVAGDAAVTVSGLAMGGGTINAIVKVSEGSFVDDAAAANGFSRVAALSIRQG